MYISVMPAVAPVLPANGPQVRDALLMLLLQMAPESQVRKTPLSRRLISKSELAASRSIQHKSAPSGTTHRNFQSTGLYQHISLPRAVPAVKPAAVRNWLQDGNLERLRQLVTDGQGHRLLGEKPSLPASKLFLRALPALMARQEEVHAAAESGRIAEVSSMLEGQDGERLAISKDATGLGLLHKAVIGGHRELATMLLERFPQTLALRDNEGRTALHYCGASTDPLTMWDLLEGSGADVDVVDRRGNRARQYMPGRQGGAGSSNSSGSLRAAQAARINGKEQELPHQVTRAHIRKWIHDRDLARLEKLVWAGQGERLLPETSSSPRVRRFLEAVPFIMSVVKEVHTAAVCNNVPLWRMRTSPPVPGQLVLSQDKNGLTPLHKAAGLGHEEIVNDILRHAPEAVKVVDTQHRSPLHFAALNRKDSNVYQLLANAGANEKLRDKKGLPPEFYAQHPQELESDADLLRHIPEAPRAPSTLPPAWNWGMLALGVDAMLAKTFKALPTLGISQSIIPQVPTRVPLASKESKIQLHKPTNPFSIMTSKAKQGGVASNLRTNRAAALSKSSPNLPLDETAKQENKGKIVKTRSRENKKQELQEESKPYQGAAARTALDSSGRVGATPAIAKPLFPPNVSSLIQGSRQLVTPPPSTFSFSPGSGNLHRPVTPKSRSYPSLALPHPQTAPGNANDTQVSTILDPGLPSTAPVPEEYRHKVQVEKAVRPISPPGSRMPAPLIERWILAGDLTRLEDALLEGRGERVLKLLASAARSQDFRSFIQRAPGFMEAMQRLHRAAASGDLTTLRALLGKYRRLALARDDEGLQPLHVASRAGQEEVIRALVGIFPRGVSVTDWEGRTPLHHAGMCADPVLAMPCYQLLLACGAPEKAKDAIGNTAADYLAETRAQHVFTGTPPSRLATPASVSSNPATPGPNLNGSGHVRNHFPSVLNQDNITDIISESTSSPNELGDQVYRSPTSRDQTSKSPNHKRPAAQTSAKVPGTPFHHSSTSSTLNAQTPEENFAQAPENAINQTANGYHSPTQTSRPNSITTHEKKTPNSKTSSKSSVFQAPHPPTPGPTRGISTSPESPLPTPNITKTTPSPSKSKVAKNPSLPAFPNNPPATASLVPVEEPPIKKEYWPPLGPKMEQAPQTAPATVPKFPDPLLEEAKLLVEARNTEKLAEMVLNGHGDKLLGLKSSNPYVQGLLHNVPLYMAKIAAVHESAAQGDVSALQSALERRKFVTSRDKYGATPLHKAVLFLQVGVTRYLGTRFPETLGQQDYAGRTPLHYAAVLPDRGALYRSLIALGADVRIRDKRGHTALDYQLHHEQRRGHEQLLHELGADPTLAGSALDPARAAAAAAAAAVSLDMLQLPLPSNDVKALADKDQQNLQDKLYVRRTVGAPLVDGLMEVSHARPRDPIAFLANYLYNFPYLQHKREPIQVQSGSGAEESQPSSIEKVLKVESQQTTEITPAPEVVNGETTQQIHPAGSPPTLKVAGELRLQTAGSMASTAGSTNRDEHGQSMLHFAATRSHSRNAFSQLLREARLSVGQRDALYRTPRDVALEAGLPENARDIDNWVLHLALEGDTSRLDELLVDGYDHILDVRDADGATVEELIKRNNVHESVNLFRTIPAFQGKRDWIHKAIRLGNLDGVREMLTTPRMAVARNKRGRCTLHVAVLAQHEAIVDFIATQFPVTLSAGDNLERTALHYAMALDKAELLSMILVRSGARRTLKDLRGRQASYYFVNRGDILKLQKEEKAELEEANR